MPFGRDGSGSNPLPLLPLRDIVLFPHVVMPLYVGREKSIAALKEAMAKKGADGKAWLLSGGAEEGQDERSRRPTRCSTSPPWGRLFSCCRCPTAR